VILLGIENALDSGIELLLNPWRGAILPLLAGEKADLDLEIPAEGWIEIDVTDNAVFVHGWPGTDCTARIGDRKEHWSDVSVPRARPPHLVAWAERTPGQVRVILTDERASPDPLTYAGSSPVLLRVDPDRVDVRLGEEAEDQQHGG